MRLATTLAAVIALTAASAHAVEESPLRLDLRLRLGGVAGIDETSGGGTTTDFDDSIGFAWQPQAILRHRLGSHFGYAIGLGIFGNLHLGDRDNGVSGIDIAYAAAGMELSGGLFWEFTPRVHIEVMPFLQFGNGRLVVDVGGTETTGSREGYTAQGFNIGGFYTFRFGLLLGGTLGYQTFSGDSVLSGTETEASGDGITGAALVGYSF